MILSINGYGLISGCILLAIGLISTIFILRKGNKTSKSIEGKIDKCYMICCSNSIYPTASNTRESSCFLNKFGGKINYVLEVGFRKWCKGK